MTTQAVKFALHGPREGREFTVTATDATVTEVTSTTDTLHLYDILKGVQLTYCSGRYAAGIGIGRIRNTVTNKVKVIIVMDVIGEEIYRNFDRPFTVDENDILETYVDVA